MKWPEHVRTEGAVDLASTTECSLLNQRKKEKKNKLFNIKRLMLKGPIGGLNQKKKTISPKSFKKRCQNQSYKPLDSNGKTLIEPKLLDPT